MGEMINIGSLLAPSRRSSWSFRQDVHRPTDQ